MSGLTRFDFYPRDWFLDTRELSDRAKGCYIDILCAMYNRGSALPYDEKYLCKLAGYKQVRSLRHALNELLASGKLYVQDGLLINNRAIEELEVANRRIESSAAGGRRRHENAKTAPKPAQMSSKSERKVDETGADIEQEQGVNPCLPSPYPSPSKNYKYQGTVIRLTETDYDRWRHTFSNIPNLDAELESRDAWLSTQPERDQKKWFVSTSKYLTKKDAEHARENAAQPNDDYFDDLDKGVIH